MSQTLSRALLAQCDPVGTGSSVRARCPFHGGDHQRSLQVNLATGRFICYCCDARGYLDTARPRGPVWRDPYRDWWGRWPLPRRQDTDIAQQDQEPSAALRARPEPQPLSPVQMERYQTYREAFALGSESGGPGEAYLLTRGIDINLARRYQLGYAPPGKWMGRWRQFERATFPECNPRGEVVNVYARTIATVPREMAHDHLRRAKGYFNCEAIRRGEGVLYVCEGVFDCLSLLMAGYRRTIAIIGTSGLLSRWHWLEGVDRLVICFDADEPGRRAGAELVAEARRRGKRADLLPLEVYHGHKDLNEVFVAGELDLTEFEQGKGK